MASKDFILINRSNQMVNVVEDYRWSVSKTKLANKETPRIFIDEYQQGLAGIEQAIRHWATIIDKEGIAALTGDVKDPYAALYSVDLKNPDNMGNKYVFPFFSDYHHAINNAWGENKGVLSPVLQSALEIATKAARAVYPSAGIESAKSFEGSERATYTFTFHLFNTVDPRVDIPKNLSLLKALINNNLMDKVNLIAQRPPAICHISIPGMRGATVGIMKTITVQNIGQLNYVDPRTIGIEGSSVIDFASLANKDEKYNIPDAYQITITVEELLVESRQVWDGALSDNSKVFANVDSSIEAVEEEAIKTLKVPFKTVSKKLGL